MIKNVFFFGAFCILLLPPVLCAQSNLVINSPVSTTPGEYNLIVGLEAGNTTVTGSSTVSASTFLGNSAGYRQTSGLRNTYVGGSSGSAMTTGNDNTFVGVGISSSTPVFRYASNGGSYNTIMGSLAGLLSSGAGNTFIGYQSGMYDLNLANEREIRSGSYNTYIGLKAGYKLIQGNNNVGVGVLAGYSNISGSYNVAIGDSTGLFSPYSSNNVFVGHHAGGVFSQKNTFIGSNAGSGGAVVNSAAIGANSVVSVSNAIVLGDTTSDIKVGIGTASPKFSLDVKGTINIRGIGGTLKFSQITNPKFSQYGNDQFLTVNKKGEVELTKFRLQIDNSKEWADKVFSKGYNLTSLSEVERFIKVHQHLPGIPSAQEVAKQGMDATELSKKLLEKIEELTLYMIGSKKESEALRRAVIRLKIENNALKRRTDIQKK